MKAISTPASQILFGIVLLVQVGLSVSFITPSYTDSLHQREFQLFLNDRRDILYDYFLSKRDPNVNFGTEVLQPRDLTEHLKTNFISVTSQIENNPQVNKPTYRGSMKAHNPAGIHPHELNQYADAFVHRVGKEHENGFIAAAAHKPGSDTVHFHSIPKGQYKYMVNEQTPAALAKAMKDNGQVWQHQGSGQIHLAHHAETAAVSKAMWEAGDAYSSHAQGYTVGQAGKYADGNPVSHPCTTCKNTLAAMGVGHT